MTNELPSKVIIERACVLRKVDHAFDDSRTERRRNPKPSYFEQSIMEYLDSRQSLKAVCEEEGLQWLPKGFTKSEKGVDNCCPNCSFTWQEGEDVWKGLRKFRNPQEVDDGGESEKMREFRKETAPPFSERNIREAAELHCKHHGDDRFYDDTFFTNLDESQIRQHKYDKVRKRREEKEKWDKCEGCDKEIQGAVNCVDCQEDIDTGDNDGLDKLYGGEEDDRHSHPCCEDGWLSILHDMRVEEKEWRGALLDLFERAPTAVDIVGRIRDLRTRFL